MGHLLRFVIATIISKVRRTCTGLSKGRPHWRSKPRAHTRHCNENASAFSRDHVTPLHQPLLSHPGSFLQKTILARGTPFKLSSQGHICKHTLHLFLHNVHIATAVFPRTILTNDSCHRYHLRRVHNSSVVRELFFKVLIQQYSHGFDQLSPNFAVSASRPPMSQGLSLLQPTIQPASSTICGRAYIMSCKMALESYLPVTTLGQFKPSITDWRRPAELIRNPA